ncbi:MAG: metal ABC transporter substrate-binding protein [Patescibacteria group bacterium]|nr:metal ABC transporter substrate-binding protein [Patescibacteria group bacterium]
MKTKAILLVLFLALVAIIGVAACLSLFSNSIPAVSGKPRVAATIFPIYDIAKNIAGDKMDVLLIAPPGASPHTFEITPERIRDLQGSKLIFAIGHGLDTWASQTAQALPNSEVIIVDKGIELIADEEESGANPHYWLSLKNARIISLNILNALKSADPINGEYYDQNTASFLSELDAADREIKKLLGNLTDKNIITMHDAWPYFAKDYGINIIASFEPYPGSEPTPQYLAELSRTAKEYNVKTIFSEPQLSSQLLIPFLEDLGMNLAVLDPEGGLAGRETYIDLMKFNAQAIHDALK